MIAGPTEVQNGIDGVGTRTGRQGGEVPGSRGHQTGIRGTAGGCSTAGVGVHCGKR